MSTLTCHDRLEHYPADAPTTPGGVVFDTRYVPTPARHWLEAPHYGERAQAIAGQGGRGAAWFVALPDGTPGALRQYRRGGLPARLLPAQRYLWLGQQRCRCLAEYRLLRELQALDLPVPAPLAAGWWRDGPWYRQALLTQRIEGACSLAEAVRSGQLDESGWAELGQVIGRFHRLGVWHADLNAHNILLTEPQRFWLIDFDRSTRRTRADPHVARHNLSRLHRSLRKLRLAVKDDQWHSLLRAWQITMGTRPPTSGS